MSAPGRPAAARAAAGLGAFARTACATAALAGIGLPASLAWPAGAGAQAAGQGTSSEVGPSFDIGLAIDAESLRVEMVRPVHLARRAANAPDDRRQVAGPVLVRVEGGRMVTTSRGTPPEFPEAALTAGDTLWVGDPDLERGDAPVLVWNGKHWRGRFKIFVGPRGRLALATRVSLERYLLGVVPGEIGALRDSLLEAGRAQAIAARSYSLYYRGRRGVEGFDLYATVEDQLYGPVEHERPLATRCVESTRGQVSTAEGAAIRANYCSTCGGVSAEVWEAWPTEPRTYLRSSADRGRGESDYCALSPQYRWREEWPLAEFAADLARFGPALEVAIPAGGVGQILDVAVLSRSRSGRVWRLLVTTTTGRIGIPAYSLRQVLRRPGNPAAILRSTLFKVGVKRDGAGRPVAIVVNGAGSGHGVGLCQTGALAMARHGERAEQILAHYYAGSVLRTFY